MVEDASGDIYGAAHSGGPNGGGVAFELVKGGGSYTETVLYAFTSGGAVGENPGPLTLDAVGDLWGETSAGVVELKPSKPQWTATLAYAGCGGGASEYEDYRVTPYGKNVFAACSYFGTVVKILPSGGGFHTVVLHKFGEGGVIQTTPNGGLIVHGSADVLGGAWEFSGGCCGSAGPTYQLTGWGEKYSYRKLFQELPTSYGLLVAGKKMFATGFGLWEEGHGSIYEVAPRDGGYRVWSIFSDVAVGTGAPVMDASGNLYYSDYDSVVKLVPGVPKYGKRVLANFSSQTQPLWMDVTGAIDGATTASGKDGFGSVFQIIPK